MELILIDGILEEVSGAYVMEQLYKTDGRPCVSLQPVSFHVTLINHQHEKRENFRVISGGHVYVLNYNGSTYKPLLPITFTQYLEMKKNNEPLWQK